MADRRALVDPRPDRLDRIARSAYGTESGGTVEALLDANPALATMVEEVPVGTRLKLPDVASSAPVATVRPWL